MEILSLFDGISCLQVAINQLGIDYKYYASEIDKKSIEITRKNFPNTKQIGDVTKVRYSYMYGSISSRGYRLLGEPKSGLEDTMWQINIDLLAGGSPCQGFSFAGKMLNFEDERSKLFFEYVRVLKEVKPKYFLFENVKMKKEYQDIITDHLFGVKPIFIDSQNLVAQQRKRLYWVGELQGDGSYKTVDIPNITGPGRMLEEYLEENVDEKYFLNEKQVEKAIENCKGKIFKSGKSNGNAPVIRINKAMCITDKNFGKENRQVNRIIQYPRGVNSGGIKGENGKIPCITTSSRKYNNYLLNGGRIRVFTEKEMERLQGLPDDYTFGVWNCKRQEMIGNGFQVDTICYILSHIPLFTQKLENKNL